MPIRMVLFDLVGTLLVPAVPVGETYAAAAVRHGFPVDAAVVTENFHRALARRRYRPRATVPSDGEDRAYWREVVRESLALVPGTLPEREKQVTEELYAHYGRGAAWRLYPEVRVVLAALRSSGRPLGVLSNWDRRARRVLADLGLIDSFSALFLSAELGAAKPDPYLYRLVAERLGLPPVTILLVGDDPENDGTAAKACGFSTWVFRRPAAGLEGLPCLLASGSLGGPSLRTSGAGRA
ncbi:HAD-IA family hydrolase [Methylacidimicrobium sp. B4]|uniref:HAD-IA family hydrolase n=1 Tax=Methylacidimicrobium sp. B4 TaxID=2796139 RepID=UPI001A8CB1F8|nr:HAD-IA family hydrolase [Methylacidimicrobium sp. B4]QSR84282.1 HAD-IA family hydrolase [Methylacidimicrobium sp. B4]